jgi:hypothetical protein
MPTTAQEWTAFVALVPYFSAYHAESKIKDRLLAVVRRYEGQILSREALLLQAGLSFFADDLDVDLALMQLVREGCLVPIADRPFTFALNLSHSKARCDHLSQKPPSSLADGDRRGGCELGTTVSKFRSGNEAARIAQRLFPAG